MYDSQPKQRSLHRLILPLTFLVLGHQAYAMGQHRALIGDYVSTIPNPTSDLDISDFLSNKSVAKELRLTDRAAEEFLDLKKASGGSLSAPRMKFDRQPSEDDVTLFTAFMTAKLEENKRRVREILDPTQLERLRQLVYRIEIARVGLQEALLNGHLGTAVGIEDYQKPALKIRAETIEKNRASVLAEIQQMAIQTIGANLTAQQLLDLKSILGKDFVFRGSDASQTLFGRTIDPEAIIDTIYLLKLDAVANDVKISKDDREAILKCCEETKESATVQKIMKLGRKPTKKEVADITAESNKERLSRVQNVLDPIQRDRLKELAYRLEIAKVGIVVALSSGFLGKRLEISTDQITKLRVQAEAIESKTSDAIAAVAEASQAELIKELEPLQRIEAVKVLGKPFAFHE